VSQQFIPDTYNGIREEERQESPESILGAFLAAKSAYAGTRKFGIRG
jgi:hypothetical protein